MNDSSFNLEDLTAELAAGQTPDDIPDELKSMMDEVMGGLGGDGGEGVGMMEKMMEHLLSKELIYPSLVDIRTQYVVAQATRDACLLPLRERPRETEKGGVTRRWKERQRQRQAEIATERQTRLQHTPA